MAVQNWVSVLVDIAPCDTKINDYDYDGVEGIATISLWSYSWNIG